MSLKNIQVTQEKKVSTKYVIYLRYKKNRLTKYLLENFYYPLFKKKKKFLIIDDSLEVPKLGLQQVIKINSKVDIDNLSQIIDTNLYQQNKYSSSNSVQPNSKTYDLILILVVMILFIFLISLIRSDKPKTSFNSRNNLISKLSEGYTLKIYDQQKEKCKLKYKTGTVTIMALEDTLDCNYVPTNDSLILLDNLLAKNIIYSDLYQDFLNTQLENSFLIFQVDSSAKYNQIFYKLNLDQIYPEIVISIQTNQSQDSFLKFNLPRNFILTSILLNGRQLESEKFFIDNDQIIIDLSKTNLSMQSLELILRSSLKPSADLRLSLVTPIFAEVKLAELEIYYSAKRQLTVSSAPTFAQPGFLRYNLPTKGNFILDLNYD